jgi:hypothetical protein
MRPPASTKARFAGRRFALAKPTMRAGSEYRMGFGAWTIRACACCSL